MDADDTVVLLEKGNLHRVEAVRAKGADRVPGRDLQYAAPRLTIDFATGGVIQIGIFSIESNAQRAVDTLTKAGIAVVSRKEESQGKAFWSVTARGDAAVLAKVKSAGFKDAYVLKH